MKVNLEKGFEIALKEACKERESGIDGQSYKERESESYKQRETKIEREREKEERMCVTSIEYSQ